jgi:hypothetical protein
MQDLKRVIQSYVEEAIANPQNIISGTAGEINWNFVDADVFMRLNPINETVDLYYKLFDEIVEEYTK